ncbi:hypothetical protein AB6A40_000138 [Gnathostoma spinigerum]|uniref:BTB domain-containing protein n=1 Tax=Gnathostoma spinigerum TaxID=75299 RepID=A0ABD6E7S6_9BILA
MAQYIKKMMNRAKSRSKSPVKHKASDNWSHPNTADTRPYNCFPIHCAPDYDPNPFEIHYNEMMQRIAPRLYADQSTSKVPQLVSDDNFAPQPSLIPDCTTVPSTYDDFVINDYPQCVDQPEPMEIPQTVINHSAPPYIRNREINEWAEVNQYFSPEVETNPFRNQEPSPLPRHIDFQPISELTTDSQVAKEVGSDFRLTDQQTNDHLRSLNNDIVTNQMAPVSLHVRQFDHHSNQSICSQRRSECESMATMSTRPRSTSPVKAPRFVDGGHERQSRSKSPVKRVIPILHTIDYLSDHCQSEGCSASIIVQDTRFLVCKNQMSHVSEYFRSLFMVTKTVSGGIHQNSLDEFAIVVSSFKYPPPPTQFKWFLDCTILLPVPRDVSDDTLETLMRLSKRFRARGLEMRCSRYIQENVSRKTPMVALCWLNWILKHKFDQNTHDACLPYVARASLSSLEKNRAMIAEGLLADILAAKLRTLYDQTVNVFRTIHGMDHFSIELDRCPQCGRMKEQTKIRVFAIPCRRLVGCERCIRDLTCRIVNVDGKMQAFFKCAHGLTALNDTAEECQCQAIVLAAHLSHVNLDRPFNKPSE